MQQYTQSYIYDAGTNLVALQHDDGRQRSQQYQMVQPNNNRQTQYTYDTAGNQLQTDTLDEMVYNADGQLCKTVRTEGTHTITEYYTYLSPGERSRKITETRDIESGHLVKLETAAYVQGIEFRASYLGANMSYNGETVTGASTTQKWTTTRIISDHGQVGKISKNDTTQATTITYNALNHLDSNELIIDEESNLVRYAHYAPYGETLKEANLSAEVQDEWGYSGEEEDSTGLLAYGYRYYQKNGLWNRADPIRFESKQLNLYTMVNGNPVTWRDAQGLHLIGDTDLYNFIKANLKSLQKSNNVELTNKLTKFKKDLETYEKSKDKHQSIRDIAAKHFTNEGEFWQMYGQYAILNIVKTYQGFLAKDYATDWQSFKKEMGNLRKQLLAQGKTYGGLENLLKAGGTNNRMNKDLHAEITDFIHMKERGTRALYRQMWKKGDNAPLEALINFGTYHDIPEWHDYPQFVGMVKRLIKAGVETGNVVHVHKENTTETYRGKDIMLFGQKKNEYFNSNYKLDPSNKKEQKNAGFEMLKGVITDVNNELKNPKDKIDIHYFGNDHHLNTKQQIMKKAQETQPGHIHLFLKGSMHFSGTKENYQNASAMISPSVEPIRKLRYLINGRGALPSAYGNGAYMLGLNTAVVWLTEDNQINDTLRDELGIKDGKLGYMEYEKQTPKKTRLENPLLYKTKSIEKPELLTFDKWNYQRSDGYVALNDVKKKLVLIQANGMIFNQPPVKMKPKKLPKLSRKKSSDEPYNHDMTHENHLNTSKEMEIKLLNKLSNQYSKINKQVIQHTKEKLLEPVKQTIN